MPTSEDYRQMANRAAQIAIACSAPSVAAALLGLALEYMVLADGLSRPILEKEQQLQEMRQDPAGYGD
jgi:type II secretory pathway component PulM